MTSASDELIIVDGVTHVDVDLVMQQVNVSSQCALFISINGHSEWSVFLVNVLCSSVLMVTVSGQCSLTVCCSLRDAFIVCLCLLTSTKISRALDSLTCSK